MRKLHAKARRVAKRLRAADKLWGEIDGDDPQSDGEFKSLRALCREGAGMIEELLIDGIKLGMPKR